MPDDFDHSIVNVTAHRPWPMPAAPWVMTQSWHDLLFAHWPVPVTELRPLVPDAFELDVFDGVAWLTVAAFHMTNVSPRGVPSLPWLSAFPELNVRTYVRVDDRPGVYFFSLDAASWPAVQAANLALNLPYYWADMDVQRTAGVIRYHSERKSEEAAFEATYAPSGVLTTAISGSLDYFLTERYCLYHLHHTGTPYRLEIHHPPWALQAASAKIHSNSVATKVVQSVRVSPTLLQFAKRQDVVVWTPENLHDPAAAE